MSLFRGNIEIPEPNIQERLQKERKLMREDIGFFQELLQTPGLSQHTKDNIDDLICRLVILYNNPVMIVKGDA